jgi:hypothetical protein
VLRRIFGPKRDEVTGEWRRLHNKELYALYSPLNIIRVIKSGLTGGGGHVARVGERRDTYIHGLSEKNMMEEGCLEDPDTNDSKTVK